MLGKDKQLICVEALMALELEQELGCRSAGNIERFKDKRRLCTYDVGASFSWFLVLQGGDIVALRRDILKMSSGCKRVILILWASMSLVSFFEAGSVVYLTG